MILSGFFGFFDFILKPERSSGKNRDNAWFTLISSKMGTFVGEKCF